MTETATRTRVRKSPADKAVEALAVAEARHERAKKEHSKLQDLLQATEAELARAERFLGYARQHPDLPRPSDG